MKEFLSVLGTLVIAFGVVKFIIAMIGIKKESD